MEKGLHRETCNLWASQITCFAPLQIKKAIHGSKFLTGGSLLRKDQVLRHPRHENRAVNRI